MKRATIVLIICLFCDGIAFTSPPILYRVIELGNEDFYPDESIQGVDINNSGQVLLNTFFGSCLWSDDNPNQRFEVEEARMLHPIDRPGSLGVSLNNEGDAVGIEYYGSHITESDHGVLWTHGGDAVSIVLENSSGMDNLQEINDRNQIIGNHELYSRNGDLIYAKGYLWQDAHVIPLSTPTRTISDVRDINNQGQIVCYTSDGPSIWQDMNGNGISEEEDFWDLGETFGDARINDRGYILGRKPTELNQLYLFFDQNENRMVEDEELRLLNRDANFDRIYSYDFNNRNEVVGLIQDIDYPEYHYAFAVNEGDMVDLNTVIPPLEGVHLYEAVAINDYGWILCNGALSDVWVNGTHMVKPYLLIPNASSGVGDHWDEFDSAGSATLKNK